jgi:hypothetical protein
MCSEVYTAGPALKCLVSASEIAGWFEMALFSSAWIRQPAYWYTDVDAIPITHTSGNVIW